MAVITTAKATGVEGMPAKVFKSQVLFPALTELGYFWRDNMLPDHFKNSATNKYGYTLRKGERKSGRRFKGSYTAGKFEDFGHTKPLVYTGKSKEESIKTRKIKAFGTSKNAAVTVSISPTFNWRPVGGRIRMQDEVARVTSGEVKILAKFLAKRIDMRLTKVGKSAKAKVVIK